MLTNKFIGFKPITRASPENISPKNIGNPIPRTSAWPQEVPLGVILQIFDVLGTGMVNRIKKTKIIILKIVGLNNSLNLISMLLNLRFDLYSSIPSKFTS